MDSDNIISGASIDLGINGWWHGRRFLNGRSLSNICAVLKHIGMEAKSTIFSLALTLYHQFRMKV